jgi:hypothetical protein
VQQQHTAAVAAAASAAVTTCEGAVCQLLHLIMLHGLCDTLHSCVAPQAPTPCLIAFYHCLCLLDLLALVCCDRLVWILLW